MNEFDIIRRLATGVIDQPGTVLGIGDDAALLEPLGLTHETLGEACEIVSFNDALAPGDNLAAVGNAIDSLTERLQTAGYRPRWLLTSITLITADPQLVDTLERCLASGCQRHRIQLIGGDLCRGDAGLTLRMLGTPTNA
jgi:thiamine-monophosphate kinase